MSNTTFKTFSLDSQLFNYLFEINSKDLIYLNQYKVPISNKYYITLVDSNSNPFANFFSYIFDDTRETELLIDLDPKTNTNLKWDKEQFYFIDLEGQKNLVELESELNEVKSIINESVGKTVLIIDIEYMIEFLIQAEKSNIPVQIYDFLLFQLKKFDFEEIIIYNKDFQYSEPNLMFEQFKLNFNIISKSNVELFKKEIIVYKKLNDNPLNIYWNVTNSMDIIDFKQQIQLDDTNNISNSEYWIGLVNNSESFITKINILDTIEKNIFDLKNNPGIVLDPLDKIFFN